MAFVPPPISPVALPPANVFWIISLPVEFKQGVDACKLLKMRLAAVDITDFNSVSCKSLSKIRAGLGFYWVHSFESLGFSVAADVAIPGSFKSGISSPDSAIFAAVLQFLPGKPVMVTKLPMLLRASAICEPDTLV